MARARQSPDPRARDGAFRCDDDAYLRWHTARLTAGARSLDVVSKPGVPGFGTLDPAQGLLLDHLEVSPTDTVVDLNCGAGVVAALAALQAARVIASDTSLAAVEAARRTLAANGVTGASVLHARGADGMESGSADVAILRIPSGKVPARQALRDAYRVLRPGGRCWLAGANDDGVKPALRHLEELFGGASVLGYRGGHRLAVAVRPDADPPPPDAPEAPWLDADHFHRFTIDAGGYAYTVCSRPGVFSWDRLDRGTAALLETMDVTGAQRILDLGCGYGIVGTAAARLNDVAHVTLADAGIEAVRSSRCTVAANGVAGRCTVIASDVAHAVPDASMDLVLANPPFHTGRTTDLDVPAQFIRDAARVLVPGGRFCLVANRTLPYEVWIRACFGAVTTPLDGREFKVLAATR
jgi:16S rRNA (guanine1207-N2)-methyltransferase